jgi:hypothetical protein
MQLEQLEASQDSLAKDENAGNAL